MTDCIKIVLVLVLENWRWGGGVLDYCALSELHPAIAKMATETFHRPSYPILTDLTHGIGF